MIKKIIRDQFFLQQKSEPATEADKQVVEDLLDTLKANRDRCVGMAANMIGVKKRIIAVAMGPFVFFYDQSGHKQKDRAISDTRELSFAGWSKDLHKVQRDRSRLPGSGLSAKTRKIQRSHSSDHMP